MPARRSPGRRKPLRSRPHNLGSAHWGPGPGVQRRCPRRRSQPAGRPRQAPHSSPAGRRDHTATLISSLRSDPMEESSLHPRLSLTSLGPPRTCTAGSGPPGAFPRSSAPQSCFGPRGPRPRSAAPASPVSLTERPYQRGSPSPRVRRSAAVPAAILDLSNRSRPAFTAQILPMFVSGGSLGSRSPRAHLGQRQSCR
ncbi:hypothetical protein NDU88_006548 [Pleurodeles waltl]|uniref:Uncharacterized protein n=1 Tax=Pleurodeles waltl TaxID=8319 RepID=A0AAV7UN30_PLEWA|nr:hypothetical protein NDU88_006548 [Pleurodeles waltl]